MHLLQKLFGKKDTSPSTSATAPPSPQSHMQADTIEATNVVQGVQIIVNHYGQQSQQPIEPKSLQAATLAYLERVKRDFDTLQIEGLSANGRSFTALPVERAYVKFEAMPHYPSDAPEFEAARTRLSKQRDHIVCDELLSLGHSVVLLAEAGQGKSIALQHLAYLLADGLLKDYDAIRNQVGLPKPLPLPILVSLGLFAQYLQGIPHGSPSQRALQSYIADEVQSRDLGLPSDFFAALIKSQQPLTLLLDGLDEVVSESLRAEVCQQIGKLQGDHPNVRVIVSSRPAAYAGRAQFSRGFLVMHMSPFATAQIKALIERAIDASYSEADLYKPGVYKAITTRVQGIMSSIEALEKQRQAVRPDDPQLIDSPLMVRLALIVYANTGHLPQQRAELLRQATDALLTASYENDVRVSQHLQALVGQGWQVQRAMAQRLALHMQLTQNYALSHKVAYTLLADLPAYAQWVNDFLAVARHRGGLFYFADASKNYRFLHNTLQAWLSACQIAQAPDVPAMIELVSVHDRLQHPIWREIALLVAACFASPDPDLHDEASLQAYICALAKLSRVADLSPASRMAAAELAAQAAYDFAEADAVAHAAAAQALADVFEHDPAALVCAPAHTRAMLGNRLAQFGDPRGHVMQPDAMRLCHVPAGPFLMGSGSAAHPSDDMAFVDEYCADPTWLTEGLTLPYDYWIGQYPITNAQYDAFVQADGYADARWWQIAIADGVWHKGKLTQLYYTVNARTSTREEQIALIQSGQVTEAYGEVSQPARLEYPFSTKYGNRSWTWAEAVRERPNHPVSNVTWYEALAFCAWLTTVWQAKGWLSSKQQVTLPSEAEWEKAARGGLQLPSQLTIVPKQLGLVQSNVDIALANPQPQRRYPWGQEADVQCMNVHETGIEGSHSVGCFNLAVSPYGVCDMAGNVWEWTCSQWGRDEKIPQFAYPYHAQDGREALIAGKDIRRVVRGGSWIVNRRLARVAIRNGNRPANRRDYQGFRVVVHSAPV